jgi:hypothetical protein
VSDNWISTIARIFADGRAVPVQLPPKQWSHMMSLSALLENLNTQDDDVTANIMAEALNFDQRVRMHLGQDIGWDATSLRRVAAALAQHSFGLERAVAYTAPKGLPKVGDAPTTGE